MQRLCHSFFMTVLYLLNPGTTKSLKDLARYRRKYTGIRLNHLDDEIFQAIRFVQH